MFVDGKLVATTTTNDIPGQKEVLFYNHFHLPDPNKQTAPKKKWGRKRKRGR